MFISLSYISFNRKFSDLRFENIFGFIINVPQQTSLWKKIITLGNASTRHWFAIRYLNDTYVNLDSKLLRPEEIGDEEYLESFVLRHLRVDSQALIIMTKEVEAEESWKNENY